SKINKSLKNGEMAKEEVLIDAMQYAKANNKKLHFIGLLSDGGVHAHIKHLEGLLQVAKDQKVKNVFVHAFTDGRDVDPKSSIGYVEQLTEVMKNTTGKLASKVGRYYDMDRDRRWERVAKAYHLLVNGVVTSASDPIQAIKDSYEAGFTDEFIQPIVLTENDQPIATINEDDVVVFFNFRTDRGRQLTQALTQEDFAEQNMKALP